jgi:hypothetical protein
LAGVVEEAKGAVLVLQAGGQGCAAALLEAVAARVAHEHVAGGVARCFASVGVRAIVHGFVQWVVSAARGEGDRRALFALRVVHARRYVSAAHLLQTVPTCIAEHVAIAAAAALACRRHGGRGRR